jgi:hypothetical protein
MRILLGWAPTNWRYTLRRCNMSDRDDDEADVEQEKSERRVNGFKEIPDEEPEDVHNPLPEAQPHAAGSEGWPAKKHVGEKLCGAKSKRTGKPCTQPVVSGSNRCRLHGGLTPRGMASPHYRHGRRSKFLKDMPKALRSSYRAALNDEELHSLDDDIAMLESRECELLRQLEKTKAPPWGMVVDYLVTYEMAARGGKANRHRAEKALAQLARAIRKGAHAASQHERIWDSLHDIINLKARAAQAEHRRRVDLNSLIPGEKALILFNAILETCKLTLLDSLEDERQAKKIMGEIALKVYKMLPTQQVIENRPQKDEGGDES